MYKHIGILTGGGDAPGLNAAIRAVVRTAIGEFGMSCVGIEDSFEGILGETHTTKLTKKSVSGILPRGGTILGTRNRGSFVKMVNGKPSFTEMPIGEALANLDILGIEALVVLGGEGTLAIAEHFHSRGFPVIGVPKTIDNDLAATELTFGFMTAIDIATEALDRLHTTAAFEKSVAGPDNNRKTLQTTPDTTFAAMQTESNSEFRKSCGSEWNYHEICFESFKHDSHLGHGADTGCTYCIRPQLHIGDLPDPRGI